MKRKNRYIIRAKISEKRFRAFLRTFAAAWSAARIARHTGLNRNTVNRLTHLVRQRIAEDCVRNGESAVLRVRAGARFWNFVKEFFARLKRVHKHRRYLHLKECEWRYNNRNRDLYLKLLAILRKNPLRYG